MNGLFKKTKILGIIVLATTMCCVMSGCSNHNNLYYNDKAIAEHENRYDIKSFSENSDESGKTLSCEIEKLNGILTLAYANDLKDNCKVKMHLNITSHAGKAKIVLVKQNSTIEVLKEIESSKESNCDEDITVNCETGSNKIKIVGSDYSGNVSISQPENKTFAYFNEMEYPSLIDGAISNKNFPLDK